MLGRLGKFPICRQAPGLLTLGLLRLAACTEGKASENDASGGNLFLKIHETSADLVSSASAGRATSALQALWLFICLRLLLHSLHEQNWTGFGLFCSAFQAIKWQEEALLSFSPCSL